MAENDGAEFTARGIDIELRDVVYDVDQDGSHLQHFSLPNPGSPGSMVVVSPHCRDWSNSGELREHVRMADISRVNDEVAAPQAFHCFGPE